MRARKVAFVVLALTLFFSMLVASFVIHRSTMASAENCVYAGGTAPGVVYYYAGGTDWTVISPLLGWSVTSIIYFEGTLFAAAITDSNIRYSSGLVYRYDNMTNAWALIGTLDNQVTFLIEYKGELYAGTATPARLYKYISATTSWNMVLEYGAWYGFRSAYSWGDWLYLGEWLYDRFARWNGMTFDVFQPNSFGSCIYNIEEYGGYLYAGAFIGVVYRLTYEPPTASVFWGPESHNRFAWSLRAFGGNLYVGFDAADTGSASLYTYSGTSFDLIWNCPTTTTNYHEGIISMTTDDTYLYVGVGGEAVGFPGAMSGAGTGEVYRTIDGSTFDLISGTLGTGVQTLYCGPGFPLTPVPLYTLIISASSGGTTSPSSGTYNYPAGSVIQIGAIPYGGYIFDHWELNGTDIGSTNPINLVMDANYSLHAIFGLAPYDVTIQAFCYTERDYVSVDISVDGGPAVFETPHTFRGLRGTHTFTVSDVGPHNHSFYGWFRWSPSNLTTATISYEGTYTAYYGIPQPPLVYVEDIFSRPGGIFTTNIYIKGVSDLFAWTAKLSWDATSFNLVSYEEGPFLKQGGATYFVDKFGGNSVVMASTLLGYLPGYPSSCSPPASGILATITLSTVAPVEGAILDLFDVELLNSQLWHIETSVQDGEFHSARCYDIEPQFGVVDVVDLSAVGANYARNVTRLTSTPTSWLNVTSEGWRPPYYVTTSDDLRAASKDDGEATMWKDFMFNTTGWSGVEKVEVGLETWIDAGSDNIVIALSNDNGTSWSPINYTHTVDTVKFDAFTWIDVTSAYAWTVADIRSIAVKLTYQAVGTPFSIRIDYLVVAVTPQPLLGPPSVFDPDADINNNRLVDIDDLVLVATNYGPYGPVVPLQFAPASSPYTSRPTNFSFMPPPPAIKVSLPTYAYDGDNGTKANWKFVNKYSAYGTEDGYFELTAYSPTASAPRGAIITQVDLAVYFYASAPTADAQYNITYVVADSVPVVLLGPTAATGYFDIEWPSSVEPKDGIWTWEDMSALRFRFGRTDPGAADSGGTFFIYEAWATVHYQQIPQISVNSPTQTQSKNFSVTVNATDIEELYGWEFKLYYNTTVLTATSVTPGPFLNHTAGGTANTFSNIIEINDAYNATHGLVWATQTIIGDKRGGRLTNGNWGVLAAVSFYIDTSGNSTLFTQTTLAGHNFVAKQPYSIQHNVTGGVVSVVKLEGDINGDGEVDSDDLTLLTTAYGSNPSKPNWNSKADLNRDNLVDALDLFMLGKNFDKAL